jgi:hypothetical protein
MMSKLAVGAYIGSARARNHGSNAYGALPNTRRAMTAVTTDVYRLDRGEAQTLPGSEPRMKRPRKSWKNGKQCLEKLFKTFFTVSSDHTVHEQMIFT